MKRIRLEELLANIRVNLVAFLSIALFVCLGVGLFMGLRWGGIAVREATQREFDKGHMHDVEVQFPYGLTEQNLEQLRKVEGVDDLEVGYSSFVTLKFNNTGQTFKLQSLTQRIDVPTSVEGRLPTKKGEIALLSPWCENNNVKVGDTFTFVHDADGLSLDLNTGAKVEDKDGMAYLTTDTFVLTAIVDMPSYLAKLSDSYGVSNSASGKIDCVGLVTTDAFDQSKFQDGFTNAYVRCNELEGLNTFSPEYSQKIAPIVTAITDLGGELATARYDDLHGRMQSKLDDGQQKVDDGQKQLEEGQQKIDDGEKQLEEGKKKLEDGRNQLVSGLADASDEQVWAQEQLDDAYRQLSDGQAKYDAGLATYNMASDLYNQIRDKFADVRGSYDLLMNLASSLRPIVSELAEAIDEFEAAVDAMDSDPSPENQAVASGKLESLKSIFESVRNTYGLMGPEASAVADATGIPISVRDMDSISDLGLDDASDIISIARNAVSMADQMLTDLDTASITVGDVTVSLNDIPGSLTQVYNYLTSTKATLESSRVQLEAGWEQYYQKKAEYEQAVEDGTEKLRTGQKELEDGKVTLEEKTKELEEGKATLEEKTKELEEGKQDLQNAKDKFAQMVKYEWVVMPRSDNGGVQSISMIGSMIDNMSWAMASLFVLVGLFVCYSAISRLVHEQSVQIGTKKALGFRKTEIAASYLEFSGLSVLLGIVASVLLGVFLVQGVMNPTVAKQYTMPAYPPYVELLGLLVMGGLELLLILASTWFAISGLVKQNAIDLLRGESTANVKTHFYERTKLWKRMSLYSQTIVNNCVNDKRRVAGTLVGVIGCTALIVTAVTLQNNVARSFERHYHEVYGYDSLVYLNKDVENAEKNVAMALYDHGISSSPVFMQRLQVRQKDGTCAMTTLLVPTNEDAFNKFYHIHPSEGGDASLPNDGVWISAAYGEHMGVHSGDEVTFTEFSGKTHEFTSLGSYDYYLIRHEFVMSKAANEEAFGSTPVANALLVDSGDTDMASIQTELNKVDGYDSFVDDYDLSSYSFNEMARLLNTVVMIYLGLSGLMAVMVLLNLDVMFVDEKKRELIVLMICGFSAKDAKAYIYRDSIALTIIGVLLGVVLGAIMGGITVAALEPSSGFFLKGFNEIAAVIGVVVAFTFAIAVLLYALRRIPRFDLTDINRF